MNNALVQNKNIIVTLFLFLLKFFERLKWCILYPVFVICYIGNDMPMPIPYPVFFYFKISVYLVISRCRNKKVTYIQEMRQSKPVIQINYTSGKHVREKHPHVYPTFT